MENELLAALGAIVETSAFLRDQLLKHGFTRVEAIRIVQTYINATITGGKQTQ